LAGAGFFAVRPDRRKFRAGDDGESGGGSGISQAKAAGGTGGASAGTGRPLPDGALPGEVLALFDAEPAAARSAETAPKDDVASASSADGFAGVSAGAAGPASFGLAPREDPMVSAGSAGMPSTTVTSAAGGRGPVAAPFAPPFAAALLAGADLAGASCFPPAGVPLGETPPPAVPSDTASSGGVVLPEADLAAVGFRAGCLGGAIMSLVVMSSVVMSAAMTPVGGVS